jgi:5'-nucleotidase / UDP-sugar diphosphatase
MKFTNMIDNKAARRLSIWLGMVILLAGVWSPPAGSADDEGVMRIHLMWTNDVHGHIAPEEARFMNPEFPPPLGGGASMARYVKGVREQAAAAGEQVILFDVGDFFQGTPVGTKTKGDAVIEFFNTMKYDALVPGNHDFDMGHDNLKRLAAQTDIPWLCANLIDKATGEVVYWAKPSMIIERDGLKIGLIGIITPATVHMAFPQNIAGLDFQPMIPAIETERDALLKDGADLICLLIHEGLPFDPDKGWQRISKTQAEAEDDRNEQSGYGYVQSGSYNLMELMNKVTGVDFAIGGHTHRGYSEPWIDPMTHTMCFESYGNGSSIGHAVLRVDRKHGELLGYEKTHDRGVLITLFEDEIWPDDEMQEALRPYIEQADAEMSAVIGSSAVNLTRGGPGNNLVGNLVTDAMCEYFDADFSFQNLGGLRSDVPAGEITARDVFSILPFGNELVIVEMDGSMIRRIVERKLRGNSSGICISGAKVSYNKTRENMNRVVEMTIGGEPIDHDKRYRVVATSFLMEGNSGLDFLTTVPSDRIELTQITTAEALEAYIRKHTPVRPRVDDRWVETNNAQQAPYLSGDYMK